MSQQTKANRGLLLAAGVAMAAALGAVAGTGYQQRAAYANTQAGDNAQTEDKAQDDNRLKPVDPKVREKTEEDMLALAMRLREKWRSAWPSRHKAEIRAMLKAAREDYETLMVVDRAMPNLPSEEETGFTDKEMGDLNAVTDPTKVQAGWSVRHPTTDPDNVQLVEQLEVIKKKRLDGIKFYFYTQRDMVLSRIFSAGTDNVLYLWVSGRVTVQPTAPKEVYGRDGKLHTVSQPHRQLLPLYDYLAEPEQRK